MRTNTALGLLSALTATVLAGSAAQAEILSPEQALSRAVSMPGGPAKVQSLTSKTMPQLLQTLADNGEPTVYLFGNTDGYMVVSADDIAPAVLGYSDHSYTINPTLQWWLSEYGRQIEWARNAGISSSAQSKAAVNGNYEPIAPMTVTKWNQDAPFNDDCPTVNGTHTVTGCVATALAQIMKYHNWPQTGTGSVSYTTTTQGLNVSVNFGSTTYQWDEMLDVYDGTATTAQKDAVATLMLSAGASVQMDYTTSESSATSFAAEQAMVNYFKYDKGITFYSRDYYTINQWNELVYNQLKEYGPVQYSGQSNDGGHSFVCDGYSSDGYFHINWGWGGMSDGYFLLTALNPTSQGIGGSTSGYNFDQDIIGNVKPADGTNSSVVPNFVAQEFTPSANSVNLGSAVSFSGPFYSYSLTDISGNYGVKLVSTDGKTTYISGSAFSAMKPQYGAKSYSVSLPTSLSEGTYSISPAVADTEGNWYDIPVLVGAEQAKSVTVANGTATFATDAAASISVTNVSVNTDFYIGAKYELTATVSNTGNQEYLGGVRLMLINSNNEAVAEGDEYPIDLNGGESIDMTYVSSWATAQGSTLSAGTYYICFVDENGYQLSDMTTVTLNQATTASLSLSNFTIVGGTTNVPKNNIEFTGDLSVTSGYFGNTLTLVIFPYTSGNVTSVATYSTDPIFLSAGQSTKIDIKADFSNGTTGGRYFAMLYNGQSPAVDNQLVFTIGAGTSGVDDLENEAIVVSTEFYDINGVRLSSPDKVAAGLYIARKTLSDGSVQVEKTAVR